jgi:hypothetical protein
MSENEIKMLSTNASLVNQKMKELFRLMLDENLFESNENI